VAASSHQDDNALHRIRREPQPARPEGRDMSQSQLVLQDPTFCGSCGCRNVVRVDSVKRAISIEPDRISTGR